MVSKSKLFTVILAAMVIASPYVVYCVDDDDFGFGQLMGVRPRSTPRPKFPRFPRSVGDGDNDGGEINPVLNLVLKRCKDRSCPDD